MQVVAHNLMANFTSRQLKATTGKKEKDIEKLSSGYRINKAADDAAGLSISEKMRNMIRGIDRGLKNTMDGISYAQIADGAMAETHDMIQRMNELSVQAANGTNSDSDRNAINNEIQQLKIEVDRVARTTKFNEEPIFEQDSRNSAPFPTMNLTGTFNFVPDFDFFNSSYDSDSKTATYGGVILSGERISWEDVSEDMAQTLNDGTVYFKEGTYDYTTSTGQTITFKCKEGTEPPEVMSKSSVSGFGTEVYIDNKRYSFSDFVDEDGRELSLKTIHSGTWTRKGSGGGRHLRS